MARYYRIQPSGLSLAHRSEDSAGERLGLHVFEYAVDTFRLDGPVSFYGDEVIVIEANGHSANGDVEGVAIDGAAAQIVARYPWWLWEQTCDAIAQALGAGAAADLDRASLDGLV
jgi:hypothetical protein